MQSVEGEISERRQRLDPCARSSFPRGESSSLKIKYMGVHDTSAPVRGKFCFKFIYHEKKNPIIHSKQTKTPVNHWGKWDEKNRGWSVVFGLMIPSLRINRVVSEQEYRLANKETRKSLIRPRCTASRGRSCCFCSLFWSWVAPSQPPRGATPNSCTTKRSSWSSSSSHPGRSCKITELESTMTTMMSMSSITKISSITIAPRIWTFTPRPLEKGSFGLWSVSLSSFNTIFYPLFFTLITLTLNNYDVFWNRYHNIKWLLNDTWKIVVAWFGRVQI